MGTILVHERFASGKLFHCQRRLLGNRTPKQSMLVQRASNCTYLHIQLKLQAHVPARAKHFVAPFADECENELLLLWCQCPLSPAIGILCLWYAAWSRAGHQSDAIPDSFQRWCFPLQVVDHRLDVDPFFSWTPRYQAFAASCKDRPLGCTVTEHSTIVTQLAKKRQGKGRQEGQTKQTGMSNA